MTNGHSAETAIKIKSDVSQLSMKISRELIKIYGNDDGAYFVHSEQLIDDTKHDKRYKVLYIEHDDKRNEVWFELV